MNKKGWILVFLIIILSITTLSLIIYLTPPYISAFINPRPASLLGSNAYLIAKDLSITVDNEEYGVNDEVKLHTPVDLQDKYTTLEATWNYEGKEKRLFIYFEHKNNIWNATKASVYDSSEDWVYFDGFSGGKFNQEKKGWFMIMRSRDNRATIKLFDYKIKPFTKPLPSIDSSGYRLHTSLESPYLEMKYEPNIDSGYGLGVVLKDRDGNIVTDLRDIKINIEISDKKVLVEDLLFKPTNSVQKCPYGIIFPCPQMNFNLKAIGVGETTVKATAVNISSKDILATTSFTVIVKK